MLVGPHYLQWPTSKLLPSKAAASRRPSSRVYLRETHMEMATSPCAACYMAPPVDCSGLLCVPHRRAYGLMACRRLHGFQGKDTPTLRLHPSLLSPKVVDMKHLIHLSRLEKGKMVIKQTRSSSSTPGSLCDPRMQCGPHR